MVICSTCTICTEYFDTDKVIAACACGHTFHEECLNRWIRQAATCPKCRRAATVRTVIKLYFEKPDQDETELDPTKLKNELDNLTAEISRRDQEKSSFHAERDGMQDRIKRAEAKVKSLTRKLSTEQFTSDTLKKQLSLLSLQMDEAKAAKKEAKRLREKLQMLERFEMVLAGNADAVEEMLTECGDGPRAVKELATYCVSLKREFQNGKDAKRRLKDDNERLKKDAQAKGKKLMEKTLNLERLENRLRSLEDDLNQVEAEKKSMKDKIKALQRTLESPNSNYSAISRLIMESPAPSLLQRPHLTDTPDAINLDDSEELFPAPGSPSTPTWPVPEPSPSTQDKSHCKEFNVPFIKTTSAANKRKRLKQQEDDDAVVMSAICNSSLFNSKRSGNSGGIMRKGFNGFGGHEKFIRSSVTQPRKIQKQNRPQKSVIGGKIAPPLPTMSNFML